MHVHNVKENAKTVLLYNLSLFIDIKGGGIINAIAQFWKPYIFLSLATSLRFGHLDTS